MNVQVSLPDDLEKFIETKVASGQYASASDVISDALRSLREDETSKLEWLREACRIGLESGDAGDIDFEQIKSEGRALLKLRAAE